jgi:hypothetical protein
VEDNAYRACNLEETLAKSFQVVLGQRECAEPDGLLTPEEAPD